MLVTILTAVVLACTRAVLLAPGDPGPVGVRTLGVTHSGAVASVRYEVSWQASIPGVEQSPIASYRAIITRDRGAVVDTLGSGNTPAAQLMDTLTVTLPDSVVSGLRAGASAIDTRGRASGFATSPVFSFDVAPLPPNPPGQPQARRLP